MIHLNRSLFVISLILYFLAGLSLVITGGVAHAQATQCKFNFIDFIVN